LHVGVQLRGTWRRAVTVPSVEIAYENVDDFQAEFAPTGQTSDSRSSKAGG
jgi:hypothetical protein